MCPPTLLLPHIKQQYDLLGITYHIGDNTQMGHYITKFLASNDVVTFDETSITTLPSTQCTINENIIALANEELEKANLNQQQLEAFRNQSQNISTQLHTFRRSPVDHSSSSWIIYAQEEEQQHRNQTEIVIPELKVPEVSEDDI